MSKRTNTPVSTDMIEERQIYMESVKVKIKDTELKYHIVTYGCQMNVHDSEKLAGMLEEMGYIQTSEKSNAAIILFNTCCVRDHAEQRVYGNIGSLRELKQQNPNLIIGVCGCMMQQKDVSEYIVRKFPFVDLIFGTHNLHAFPRLLLGVMNSMHTIVEVLEGNAQLDENLPMKRGNGVSAWVTIMYGCDNFCSYCVVPYVRGRERSRSSEEIVDEINALAKQGYKEVFLLGQNVNSYGHDLERRYFFHDLLQDIERTEGIERIRFITSHPKDLSIDLIRLIARSKKICEHIHLPIQSGSDRILSEMNRRYMRQDYLDLVDVIRRNVPDIALTTDIIVGFPGETQQDFEETLDLMKKVRFDLAFTFMYSSRKDTPAANMLHQVEHEVKKQRLDELNRLQAEIGKEKNAEYQNSIVEVMVEGVSKTNRDMWSGRTRTNKLVNFQGDNLQAGSLVKVKIIRTKSWTLEGVIV